MAAIFGVVDFTRPSVRSPRKVVQHMATVHGLSLATDLDLYGDGWVGMGYLPERFQTHPRQDIFYINDRLVTLVEGDILNRASIAAASRIPLDTMKQISLPQLICHAFEHRGPALFDEIDGSYRIIIWDHVDKLLYVVADRYGFRPIFYKIINKRMFFGSEIKFLLKGLEKLPEINPQAIADFLSFGYPISSDTFFDGIVRLPGAHFLQMKQEQIYLIRYDEVEPEGKSKIRDAREAVSLLRNAAITGVKAYSDTEPTRVLLSGGIHSRLVAAAQKRLGYPVATLTVGEPSSADAQIAGNVARNLPSRHYLQKLSAAAFLDNFSRSVWLSDGLLNGLNATLLGMVPFLKYHPSRLLDGMQPMHGPFRSLELLAWRLRKWNLNMQILLIERLFQPVYRPNDMYMPAGKIFREELYQNILTPDDRLQGIAAQLDFSQLTPAEAIQKLDRHLRQPNLHALKLHILRHYVRVSSPLYTFAFLETVANLPEKWQASEKILIRQIIQQLNPGLAQIPWQPTMLPLNVSPKIELAWSLVQLLNQHFHFYRGKATENSPMVQQPIFNFLQHLGSSRLFQAGIKYYLFELLPDEMINRHAVRKLLTLATRYHLHVEEMLARVMTINLWYHYFVKGQSPAESFCQFQMEKSEKEAFMQQPI